MYIDRGFAKILKQLERELKVQIPTAGGEERSISS